MKGNQMNTLGKFTMSTIGVIGGSIATALGGWDVGLKALIACVLIDYITGLLVAGVFHNSGKTKNGALESRAGFKGLCKKGVMLLIVLTATLLDAVVGTEFIRNSVVFAFITNELLSIVENAGLMGIPMPAAITKAIEILKTKSEVQ